VGSPRFLLFALIVGCAAPYAAVAGEIPRLSITELRKNPAKYHMKTIEVSGVVSSRFDRTWLYGSVYDLCAPNPSINYVLLDLRDPSLPATFDRNAVVRGTFVSGSAGAKRKNKHVKDRLQNVHQVDWTTSYISACY